MLLIDQPRKRLSFPLNPSQNNLTLLIKVIKKPQVISNNDEISLTWTRGFAICWFSRLPSTIPFSSMFINTPAFVHPWTTLNLSKATIFIASRNNAYFIRVSVFNFQAFVLTLC